jgi:hypothetical protein
MVAKLSEQEWEKISKDNNRNPETGERKQGTIQYKKPIGPKPQSEREKQKQWNKQENERKRVEKEERKERNKRDWEEKRQKEADERERKRREEQSKDATRQAERIADRQSTQEWREIEKKNAKNKPYEPKELITPKSVMKSMGDKVGGVLLSGKKEVPINQRNPGRSGRRASLEYRRANREYNSEARKMRSQVTPLSSFSAGLLGANSPPTRSKYGGTRETGSIDPLSNWSSGIMGAGKVRQDSTMEGIASKMAGRQNPGRKSKPSSADPLANLTKMLRGR